VNDVFAPEVVRVALMRKIPKLKVAGALSDDTAAIAKCVSAMSDPMYLAKCLVSMSSAKVSEMTASGPFLTESAKCARGASFSDTFGMMGSAPVAFTQSGCEAEGVRIGGIMAKSTEPGIAAWNAVVANAAVTASVCVKATESGWEAVADKNTVLKSCNLMSLPATAPMMATVLNSSFPVKSKMDALEAADYLYSKMIDSSERVAVVGFVSKVGAPDCVIAAPTDTQKEKLKEIGGDASKCGYFTKTLATPVSYEKPTVESVVKMMKDSSTLAAGPLGLLTLGYATNRFVSKACFKYTEAMSFFKGVVRGAKIALFETDAALALSIANYLRTKDCIVSVIGVSSLGKNADKQIVCSVDPGDLKGFTAVDLQYINPPAIKRELANNVIVDQINAVVQARVDYIARLGAAGIVLNTPVLHTLDCKRVICVNPEGGSVLSFYHKANMSFEYDSVARDRALVVMAVAFRLRFEFLWRRCALVPYLCKHKIAHVRFEMIGFPKPIIVRSMAEYMEEGSYCHQVFFASEFVVGNEIEKEVVDHADDGVQTFDAEV
jgi:hypothetical protein